MCSAKGVVKWLHFCICCSCCLSMWLTSRGCELGVCGLGRVAQRSQDREVGLWNRNRDTQRRQADSSNTQQLIHDAVQACYRAVLQQPHPTPPHCCKPAAAAQEDCLLCRGFEGFGVACRGTQEASWSKTCLRSWELISIRSGFKICPKSSESRYSESHK